MTDSKNEHETEHEVDMLPRDAHNRRLLDNVHPPDWTNPEPEDDYHLVAIGGGTAGLVSAAGASGLGARAALIERELLGGDCLNVGCVPSKGVIRAARAWHEVRRAAERFGGPEAHGGASFADAMERMRKIRADISKVDSAARYRDELGVDVFLGQARFVAADAVEVAGKRLKFRRCVITTGARAAAPPIDGLEDAGYRTNETIFSLTELPRSLTIIGGGPIGCEMAQSFARFGSEVTLVDMASQVLTREDAGAAAIVQEAMKEDGVRFEFDAKITRVSTRDGERVVHFERDGQEHEVAAQELLVAVGRKPNLDGLDLEAAGVEYTKRGVTVDEYLQTSNPRIYAAGDIALPLQFTHTADAGARIVLQNALFSLAGLGRAKWTDLVVPWVTYTSPEIAHVGMYEKDAQEKGLEVDTVTVDLEHVDRALLDGEAKGFCRIHLEKGKDRILGATIVAHNAGDMISELTLAITQKIRLGKIASVIHPYPTQAECIKRAADQWRRTQLTPTAKKAIGLRLGMIR